MSISLHEIAKIVQGVVIGNDDIIVSSLSPIENIAADSLVFADGPENLQAAEQSDAAAILTSQHVTHSTKSIIQTAHPFKAFIQLLDVFYPVEKPITGIHPSAAIAPDVKLGQGVFIGPYVSIESGTTIHDGCILKSHISIGKNVTIGQATIIHPHVTIYDDSQIGANVCIHASSVIGSDGFGYTFIDGQHLKVPHKGKVIIDDHVEIGANTVIDRATLGATHIGAGTKIDNLVQVAHSVKLGKNNILCAFTGIAGSTTSGNQVIFAANVGVSDHVRIDDGVILGARAGVPPKKHLKAGNIYLGNPARPKDKALEQELGVTRIAIMRKNLRLLNDKVNELSVRLAQYEASE
ncbi:UDP-3-O-(R-3-hydroxymyristoyl)-glucosamine N-acyltransferase [Legionella beliardensis]|uniref:UDP-3-O-acylglucosamine N-acyltransferase n=1 Tax=Legionella beliardensis TaxID=91822 RepID=A0A378I558_9GAMM|nr:UDP-3-O-(3-hydroxymyristoyl)glucosamine N-acyltransferase [Legionella beliardensis]STX27634.1 UDP-3-O-(R-3-hydroxymyristoyl)-glucosamine N-acyltransferase [Legionella beliardensis]